MLRDRCSDAVGLAGEDILWDLQCKKILEE